MTSWRSTKNDPPAAGARVFSRSWDGKAWQMQTAFFGNEIARFPDDYPSWAPFPDPNDGSFPEDWQ